jgi:enoyl-CoA hydratase
MDAIRVEIDGPVTTILIDRLEKRNAVDGPMAKALAEAFATFDADPAQRVAVLHGEHGVFCAGADLSAIGDPERGHEFDPEGAGTGPMGPTRMFLTKPLIAAVSGYAVAGGLELALLADLRVVEESATFGVFCRRWGVPLIDGGTVRLPRVVGMGRALDMILTGRAVGAREATEMGLANRVVADRARRGGKAGARDRRVPASLHADRSRLRLPAMVPAASGSLARGRPRRHGDRGAGRRRGGEEVCGRRGARGEVRRVRPTSETRRDPHSRRRS